MPSHDRHAPAAFYFFRNNYYHNSTYRRRVICLHRVCRAIIYSFPSRDPKPLNIMSDPCLSPDDTRPIEPVEPDLNECCGNGCTPCVFDTYAEEKRHWQEAVRIWDLRHPDAVHKPD